VPAHFDIRNAQYEIRNTNLHRDLKAVRHKAAVGILTLTVCRSKARRTPLCFLDTVDKFCLLHFSGAYAETFCLAFYLEHCHSFFLYFCCWHSFPFQFFLRPALKSYILNSKFYILNSAPAYSCLPASYSSCSSLPKSIIYAGRYKKNAQKAVISCIFFQFPAIFRVFAHFLPIFLTFLEPTCVND